MTLNCTTPAPHATSSWKTLWVSILLAIAVWALFSWPLPRYLTTGVPSSSSNVEKGSVRAMIPGDHLQLIYNYWVFSDMLSGHTPFFHNLYEFNTGDDEARKYIGFDFMPFTLLFTVGNWLGGRALAWNLCDITTVWLTILLSWLFLRRFIKRDNVALLGALAATAVPYRWAVQLGGSPTGLAMVCVPALLWGLHGAVRGEGARGGLYAVLALLVAYLNDAHVFFFCFLAAPVWCLAVMVGDERFTWRDVSCWRRAVIALLPFGLTALFLLLLIHAGQADTAQTTIEDGRHMDEVRVFTPNPMGLFAWRASGQEHAIYIGFLAPLLCLMGLIALPFSWWRSRTKLPQRNEVFFLLILLGLGGLVVLALGPNGPLHGRLFEAARHAIPPYAMIRQPAKIFALLPPFLGLAVCLATTYVRKAVARRPYLALAPLFLLLMVPFEYLAQIRPTVCLLDREQPAYAAIRADAVERGVQPHLLALPIWPGDSAWTSLYQHYASLYRIRMVNGYLPVVPRDYIENIYQRFEYLNGGIIDDDILDDLLKRGVQYLVLHEDAFPEKVSSFPVAYTLSQLLAHPRIQLLRQGENVWAFRIRTQPVAAAVHRMDWKRFFPSYNSYFEAEWFADDPGTCIPSPATAGGVFVRLNNANTLQAPEVYHCRVPAPTTLIRCRGEGELQVDYLLDTGERPQQTTRITSTAWTWRALAWPPVTNGVKGALRMSCRSGAVDVDVFIFSSGHLLGMKPAQSVELPASLFFHAGYSDLSKQGIVLRKAYEPDREIVYGPHLPLDPGTYTVELHAETAAAEGTTLGSFQVTLGDQISGPFPVVAGQPAAGRFSTPEVNLPLRFAFHYARTADMMLGPIVLRREK